MGVRNLPTWLYSTFKAAHVKRLPTYDHLYIDVAQLLYAAAHRPKCTPNPGLCTGLLNIIIRLIYIVTFIIIRWQPSNVKRASLHSLGVSSAVSAGARGSGQGHTPARAPLCACVNSCMHEGHGAFKGVGCFCSSSLSGGSHTQESGGVRLAHTIWQWWWLWRCWWVCGCVCVCTRACACGRL